MEISKINEERIINFHRKFGESHFMFACQASVPLLFSTELLYKLWLNFNTYTYEGKIEKISYLAVSDLVLSSLSQPVGAGLYKMDEEIRDALSAGLIEKLTANRQNQIALFLKQFAQKYYTITDKNLQDIHIFTADSILDPQLMQKQIADKIFSTSNDYEKVNLLSLYFNLSTEKNQIDTDQNYLTLVPETDITKPNVLKIPIPDSLLKKMRRQQENVYVETDGRDGHNIALKIIDECIKNKTTYLHLGNYNLTDEELKEDGLIGSKLRQCTHLESLNLSNPLLDVLEEKWISSENESKWNMITELPQYFSSFIKLKEFVCSGQIQKKWGISDINVLTTLSELTYLDLSYNEISSISGLNKLDYLQTLLLQYNQIKDLNGIGHFQYLLNLDFQFNKIEDIRPLLWFLQRSDYPMKISIDESSLLTQGEINITGNPITNPPIKILYEGNEAILNFLKEERILSQYIREPENFPNTEQQVTDLDRRLLVARIWRNTQTHFGTGFLIKGYLLNRALGEEIFLLTNKNIISDDPGDQALSPGDAIITLEAMTENEEYRVSEIVWSSPVSKLDVSLLRFDKKSHDRLSSLTVLQHIPFYSIARPISPGNVTEKIQIIGYPDGFVMNVTEGRLIKIELLYMTYDVATEPGSSGNPVFNSNWELMGIHHLSYKNRGEGILIEAIIKDISESMPAAANAEEENFKQEAYVPGFKYDVFVISHTVYNDGQRRDDHWLNIFFMEFTSQLAFKTGIHPTVFYDHLELQESTTMGELNKEIENSVLLLNFISEYSLQSALAKHELDKFSQAARSKRDKIDLDSRIFNVILDSTVADKYQKNGFPFYYKNGGIDRLLDSDEDEFHLRIRVLAEKMTDALVLMKGNDSRSSHDASEEINETKKPTVYFIFAPEDGKYVKDLSNAIKQAGADIWSDSSLQIGDSLDEEYKNALLGSDYIIIVLSGGPMPGYMTDEINLAIDYRKNIIPVLNGDEDLPLNLLKLDSYQRIDLTKNYETGFQHLLEKLDLLLSPENDFEEIQPGSNELSKRIFNVKKERLTQLDLSDLGLTEMPDEIFNFYWLEELNLAKNKIKDFSQMRRFTGFDSLKNLNLSENNIENIGDFVLLKNLTHLDLSLNRNIKDYSALKSLRKLEELYLNQNGILQVSFLSELPRLNTVDLSYNRLKNANDLAKLINLQTLDLGHNALTNLKFIVNLKNLKSLYLNNNRITIIEPLQNLAELSILDIRNNLITMGFKTLDILIQNNKLESLQVYGNNFADIPAEIIGQKDYENNLSQLEKYFQNTRLENVRARRPFDYKAYISYTRADEKIAKDIASELTANGINIFLDSTNIVAGENWAAMLQDAILQSEFFVVILSFASVSSEYVLHQINFALKSNKKIISLLINDCKIPENLRLIQHINMKRGYDSGFKMLLQSINNENERKVLGKGINYHESVLKLDQVLLYDLKMSREDADNMKMLLEDEFVIGSTKIPVEVVNLMSKMKTRFKLKTARDIIEQLVNNGILKLVRDARYSEEIFELVSNDLALALSDSSEKRKNNRKGSKSFLNRIFFSSRITSLDSLPVSLVDKIFSIPSQIDFDPEKFSSALMIIKDVLYSKINLKQPTILVWKDLIEYYLKKHSLYGLFSSFSTAFPENQTIKEIITEAKRRSM